jgi:hypothetical protein
MELMKKGILPEDALISGVYPSEKAQEAMERWNDSPAKIFRILIEF